MGTNKRSQSVDGFERAIAVGNKQVYIVTSDPTKPQSVEGEGIVGSGNQGVANEENRRLASPVGQSLESLLKKRQARK